MTQRHFGKRRAFIDHKRPIKTIKQFALFLPGQSFSFRDLVYTVTIEPKQLCLLKMASTIFVHWSDGWAFDRRSRNGERNAYQRKIPAWQGI